MESLKQHELIELSLAARQAVSLGREVLKEYFGRLSRVDEKYLAGLVTEADVESERAICEFLLKKFPNIKILGEEGSVNMPDSEKEKLLSGDCWVLDPLDGTTNYVHQFPIYCISLGLVINNEVVVGVVDAPHLNQTFVGIKNYGAFVNDLRISVSHRKLLKDSLLATGFYSPDQELLREQVELFSKIIHHTRGVRRPGAAAYDLCMVAIGSFDGFWEKNLNPWDTAAGSLIVQEAGGLVTDFSGHRHRPNEKEILATNGHIHQLIIDKIKNI